MLLWTQRKHGVHQWFCLWAWPRFRPLARPRASYQKKNGQPEKKSGTKCSVIWKKTRWQADQGFRLGRRKYVFMDAMLSSCFLLRGRGLGFRRIARPCASNQKMVPRKCRAPYVLSYGKKPVAIGPSIGWWEAIMLFKKTCLSRFNCATYWYEGTTVDRFDRKFSKWFLLEDCTEQVSSISVKGWW